MLGRSLDHLDVAAFQRLLQVCESLFDRLLVVCIELVGHFLHALLGGIHKLVSLVANLDLLLALLVFACELLRLVDRALDLLLGEIAGGCDGHLLLVARAEILCRNVNNAVRVDIKCDLNLRYAARCGRDSGKLEAAESLVILRHFTLALQHMHFDARLAVCGGGEDLALLRRDGRVAVDQAREHAAHGLDAKGQRRNVEQQNVLDLAAENAALNGRADSDALIRVDALEGIFAGNLLDHLLHSGNTGRTADENDLVDLRGREACVGHCLLDADTGLVDQVADQIIELRTADRHVEVLRAGSVHRDERQIDVRLRHAGEVNLCLFGSFLQTLHCHFVGAQIDAVALLELIRDVVHEALVEVVAAQAVVARRCKNLEHAVADLKNGNIERAATEVVHEDLLVLFFIHAVCKCGSRRLVDDTEHLETRDATRILRRLTLAVGEVCRHRDDRLRDRFAEIALRFLLELLQDHGRDLLRRVVLAVNMHFAVGTHVALDRRDRALRVRDRLTLCKRADHALAVLKRDDGRCGAGTLRVRDHDGLAAFQNSNAGIGSTQINADNFTHNCILLFLSFKLFFIILRL